MNMDNSVLFPKQPWKVNQVESKSGRDDCDKYPFSDFLTSAGCLMLTLAAPLKRFIKKDKAHRDW